MATVIDICNAALSRLGQEPLQSLDDGSKWADLCKSNWPLVRDAVLRNHKWPCATKRVILSPLAESPPFGYSYQFQLPADYLRLWEEDMEDAKPFVVEGDRLLADVEEVNLVYTARIEAGEFDSVLTEAMVKAMMAAISYAVTHSATMQERVEMSFAATLQEAKAKTTTEKGVKDDDDNYSWIVARY